MKELFRQGKSEYHLNSTSNSSSIYPRFSLPCPAMGIHRLGFTLIVSVIATLGLVCFALCLVAEAKRPKRDNLRLDGKLCFLPATHASVFGFAAVICLSIAQSIGNMVVCVNYWWSGKARKTKKSIIFSAILLAISWVSFAFAVSLISAATSMSRKQPYGEGWLDGECYMVRDGVYLSCGFISLAAVFALLGAAVITNQGKGQKIYA